VVVLRRTTPQGMSTCQVCLQTALAIYLVSRQVFDRMTGCIQLDSKICVISIVSWIVREDSAA